MARFVLEQLSDYRDYTGGGDVKDILTQGKSSEYTGSDLSDVRVSPDGRHIHIILRKPTPGLVTCDKYEKPQLALSQKKQDLCITRTVPIVDVFYLESNSSGPALFAVIYETGKAEFWQFHQESKPGWHLLQTSDLCNSPRAKVVSVCASSNSIIWCEERPPSESSPVLSSTRNKLRYCVCRRDFEVDEGGVVLRGVKIALHNNPKFNVISSGEYVHLLPDSKLKALSVVNKILISWSPRMDTFRLSTTCKGTPLKEDVLFTKESDFKRLLTDCLGFLSVQDPPEVCCYSPTGCGGLLLLLSTGWVCFLQKDGILRQVHKLDDNFVGKYSHTSLCLYQETAALLTEQSLYLVDINCGTEHGGVKMKNTGLLFRNQADRCTPHFVSEEGIFVVHRETETKDVNSKLKFCGSSKFEKIKPGALLIEAIFEEACTYYQQRSLSSARLTVDALKKGGRFQAPISLATILGTYLSSGWRHRGAQNGVQNGDDSVAGQDKLMNSLEPELKALVALEEVKGRLVKGSVKEVEALCESLVEKEVSRLLSSSDLDKDSLFYLNTIFKIFPCQSWRAVQVTLQFHYNGENHLSSSAPHEIWKTVLSPAPSSPVGKPCTNGEAKSNLNGNHIGNVKVKSQSVPAVLPVFELLCHSVYRFEPSWLPSFLELSQQQQGSAGLALTLASSSWGFSGGRGADSSDYSVPLYKRALSVVSSLSEDRDHNQDLEVELLLVSGRPNAILQAMRILMGKQQWFRVTQVAQKFCKQSPLLNKEIFSTLLCEVAQHRELDPYLELLWSLCPEDITVTNILNTVLKSLPSPKTSSSSFPLTNAATSAPAPFADPQSSQLTIGLLKPLLRKVLERETKSNQGYADILQSPSYPPPAPPRQAVERLGTGASQSTESDQGIPSAGLSKQHNQPPSQNNVQKAPVNLPGNLK